MNALKTLSKYLKSLKKWKPDGGPRKVKGVWDGRQFNLRHFAQYPYTVIIGDEDEVFYYLIELDNQEQAYSYWRHNQVGCGCFRILDLSTGIVVSEWYSYTPPEERDKRNRCSI